jgi:hypothetical protein
VGNAQQQSVDRPPLTLEDIRPMALYDARDVAEVLGIDRDSVYEIPEDVLARVRVGPRRGRTRFYGWAITAYLAGDA